MASLNKVLLMGNLTKDPGEPRKTPSGMAVADLRMALNRKFKAPDGSMKDETCYVTVTVWGRQAETCSQYLSKGSPVLVEGRLKYDEWEKNGQKQNRLSVVAERVQFIGGPRSKVESAGAPSDMESAPTAHSAADDGPAPEPTEGDSDNLPF